MEMVILEKLINILMEIFASEDDEMVYLMDEYNYEDLD